MKSQKLITCACGCGKQRYVLLADFNRGKGLYYNRQHQYRAYAKERKQKREELEGVDFDLQHLLLSPWKKGLFEESAA